MERALDSKTFLPPPDDTAPVYCNHAGPHAFTAQGTCRTCGYENDEHANADAAAASRSSYTSAADTCTHSVRQPPYVSLDLQIYPLNGGDDTPSSDSAGSDQHARANLHREVHHKVVKMNARELDPLMQTVARKRTAAPKEAAVRKKSLLDPAPSKSQDSNAASANPAAAAATNFKSFLHNEEPGSAVAAVPTDVLITLTKKVRLPSTFTSSSRGGGSHLRYKYESRSHFRDTINQFQGRQNKRIPPDVLKQLEYEFDIHHLALADDPTLPNNGQPKISTDEEVQRARHRRYAKITKQHILQFLNETKNSKYYEDINLLYRYYTGHPCPDISKYEKDLMDDFDLVEAVYERLPIHRDNFLNANSTLYQLLRRRGYKCRIGDFSILKTRDRIVAHDMIMQRIFEALEWKFYPLS